MRSHLVGERWHLMSQVKVGQVKKKATKKHVGSVIILSFWSVIYWSLINSYILKPGLVAHAFNPSPQTAKAAGFLWFSDICSLLYIASSRTEKGYAERSCLTQLLFIYWNNIDTTKAVCIDSHLCRRIGRPCSFVSLICCWEVWGANEFSSCVFLYVSRYFLSHTYSSSVTCAC